MHRRNFLQAAIALAAAPAGRAAEKFDLAAIERPRVLKAADRYLAEQPVTVTASNSPLYRQRTMPRWSRRIK